MKGFIELTLKNSKEKILINTLHIVYVRDNTVVVNANEIKIGYHASYDGSMQIEVAETYDEVLNLIRNSMNVYQL